ncbi:MAG: hypothetical protein CMH57_01200 [Myxococcales bacterium]|nr:hypothetical protein [Myxococcales bacterium]
MTDDTQQHPAAARWQRPAMWIGLGAAVVALALHAHHFDFINDDAFISFRYADNLVRHGELTYNVGERVEGYTNFLWTLVIAGVLALGGDAVVWSKALGVLCSAGTLLSLALFTRWWVAHSQSTRSPLWACLAPALLAVNSAFACWSEGGLETALFTFWVTAAVLRYVVERLSEEPPLPWSGALLALAAMTRPEGVLLFGLLGLHRLGWQAAVERIKLPPKDAWLWGALFVGLYLPYWLWRFNYYGYPFPNTYYAKGDQALWGLGWLYVSSFVTDCHVWIVLPLMALPSRMRGAGALRSVALVFVVPFLLYVTRVGGDFMALWRFLVPTLPVFALLAQEGAADLTAMFHEAWRARHGDAPGRLAQGRLLAAGLALFVLLGVHNGRLTQRSLEVGSENGVDSIGWLKMFVDQLTPIGHALAATYPPETSIAVTAAGVIPYYARLRTLDLLALNDVYTAHNVQAHRKRPGHAKAAPEPYVLKWAPTLLIWQPRLSDHQPRARPGEQRYWKARGYTFRYAQVPGLTPPWWSWYERAESVGDEPARKTIQMP